MAQETTDNSIISKHIEKVKLQEAKKLLKESVDFMNLVPNRKYGDNYTICSKIDKFLKQ